MEQPRGFCVDRRSSSRTVLLIQLVTCRKSARLRLRDVVRRASEEDGVRWRGLRRSVLTGVLAALALALNVAPLEARYATTAGDVAHAAEVLTARVHLREKVPIDAAQQVLWTTPRSRYAFQYLTPAPIVETIRGVRHYFYLVQRRRTLSSVIVRAIPTGDLRGVLASALVYTRVHAPGIPEKRVTNKPVIYLDPARQPVARFVLNDGTRVTAPVGQLRVLDSDVITA